MFNKRGQEPSAALEITVLVIIIGIAMVFYILLLPPADRDALLNEEPFAGDVDGEEAQRTLLSDSPGKVASSVSATRIHQLEPIRLYSTTEQITEPLAASLTISKNLFQNNYRNIIFDVDNVDELERLQLLFFVSDSKGDLVIELNGNVIYEGKLTGNDVPLDLPISSLVERDNSLVLSTTSPGINIFSSHYYFLQDIKLLEDYAKQDTVSTRTFSVENPGDVTSTDLTYFISCNSDDSGILTITLNSREIFGDRVFCEYLNERELSLDTDLLQTTNVLRFEITEGDYNIEQVEVEVDSKSENFPTYSFEVTSSLYDEVQAGTKDIFLILSFSDSTSDKKADVFVQEFAFAFDTQNDEYEKDISSYIDNGANTVTIKPKSTFEIDNIKAVSRTV
jgi:hypothetical protein